MLPSQQFTAPQESIKSGGRDIGRKAGLATSGSKTDGSCLIRLWQVNGLHSRGIATLENVLNNGVSRYCYRSAEGEIYNSAHLVKLFKFAATKVEGRPEFYRTRLGKVQIRK